VAVALQQGVGSLVPAENPNELTAVAGLQQLALHGDGKLDCAVVSVNGTTHASAITAKETSLISAMFT